MSVSFLPPQDDMLHSEVHYGDTDIRIQLATRKGIKTEITILSALRRECIDAVGGFLNCVGRGKVSLEGREGGRAGGVGERWRSPSCALRHECIDAVGGFLNCVGRGKVSLEGRKGGREGGREKTISFRLQNFSKAQALNTHTHTPSLPPSLPPLGTHFRHRARPSPHLRNLPHLHPHHQPRPRPAAAAAATTAAATAAVCASIPPPSCPLGSDRRVCHPLLPSPRSSSTRRLHCEDYLVQWQPSQNDSRTPRLDGRGGREGGREGGRV